MLGGQTGPGLAALGAVRDARPDHAETLDVLAAYWSGTRSMTDALDAAERLSLPAGLGGRGAVRLGRLRSELFDPDGAAADLAGALRRDPGLEETDATPPRDREAPRPMPAPVRTGRRGTPADPQLDDVAGSTDPEAAWLLSRALLQEGRLDEARAAIGRAKGFAASDPMRQPPFVGAELRPCHPDQYESQQRSRHARTLQRTGALRGPALAGPGGHRSEQPARHDRIGRAGDRVEAATEVDGRLFRAVVAYALGSNHQGQSFLARDDRGQAYELRISRYPAAPEWDRTMEHPAVPPDPAGYLGRPVSSESFRKCLHCHATNFRAVREPEGRPEAPTGASAASVATGRKRITSRRSRPTSPNRRSRDPGSRPPRRSSRSSPIATPTPPSTTPDDAGFVRYQASGFVLSRCYTESSEGFGCVTCHDPHKDAGTSVVSYEAKCLECHGSPRTSSTIAKTKPAHTGPPCPVNPRTDCLSCHMPRVKDAVPRTVFTDHWIRVRRP